MDLKASGRSSSTDSPINWSRRGLWLLYLAFGILVIAQAFTNGFVDQNEQLLDNYFISQGLIPYVDFFEHHPLFQNILLSPMFWLTGPSTTALLGYILLAIVGVFFCAWLVFRLAIKNKLQNPHAASLLFLAGYTGLTITFLRYEFWSMLFLLAFFLVSRPFWKGLFLIFCGATSPIILFPTAAIGLVHAAHLFRSDRRALLPLILGGLSAFLIWFALHFNITFSSMYYAIFTFNNKVGHLPGYALQWQEVTFFTFFFVVPIILVASPILLREWGKKNESAILATVFSAVFLLQILAMNVAYGAFTRIKLPAPLPLLALLIVFIAGYGRKMAFLCIVWSFMLVMVLFTPSISFPQLDVVRIGQTLDTCIAPDASMLLEDDPQNRMIPVPIFRVPGEYYWFVQKFVRAAGIPYERPQGIDPVALCGNRIERADWTCSATELATVQRECNDVYASKTIWSQVLVWHQAKRAE